MAYKGGGGGGGEVIPAGDAPGDLLVWDGSEWVPTPGDGLPTAGTNVGSILVWDGFDWAVQGLVVPSAGNVLQWDGDTWEPNRETLGFHTFGSVGLGAIASQFFGPEIGTTGQASRNLSGEYCLSFDCLLDRFGAIHANSAAGTANPVTYFLHIAGADSALTVTGNTNAAGPFTDLVNTVNYTAFTPFCVRGSWPTAAGQAIRPAWTVRARSRSLT